MKFYSSLCAATIALAACISTTTSARADFNDGAHILVALFTTPFSGPNGGRSPIPSYPDKLTPELRKMIDDIIDNNRAVADGHLMELVRKRLAEREAERRASEHYIRLCQEAFLSPKECAQVLVDVTRPAAKR